jgi:hypothetical protein
LCNKNVLGLAHLELQAYFTGMSGILFLRESITFAAPKKLTFLAREDKGEWFGMIYLLGAIRRL